MSYKRIMSGFFVEVTDLKSDKSGDMASVKVEVFTENGGTRLCKAHLNAGYVVQGVAWTDNGEMHQHAIAKIGLNHHNAHALNNSRIQRYLPRELETDREVFQAMLEHGIAVLVEDRLRDDYYRARADEFIFARTSKDQIASIPGTYDPNKRGCWREYINERLPDDEDVLEIINDRYIN
ncbi:hypothetical protein [Marinobacter sp.]|uniref:hypothetical protein n=1 Tax=Marinobacter sp. TaxID=50741 RepID=UPI00356524F9